MGIGLGLWGAFLVITSLTDCDYLVTQAHDPQLIYDRILAPARSSATETTRRQGEVFMVQVFESLGREFGENERSHHDPTWPLEALGDPLRDRFTFSVGLLAAETQAGTLSEKDLINALKPLAKILVRSHNALKLSVNGEKKAKKDRLTPLLAQIGEIEAAAYLVRQGYKIYNLRVPIRELVISPEKLQYVEIGEMDILLYDPDEPNSFILVEVKKGTKRKRKQMNRYFQIKAGDKAVLDPGSKGEQLKISKIYVFALGGLSETDRAHFSSKPRGFRLLSFEDF